jgi:hypothetical protein
LRTTAPSNGVFWTGRKMHVAVNQVLHTTFRFPLIEITSPISNEMPHIAYLVVQQNISSCCRADISRSLGFQALPTSFGVVRSAPKRSLADSSDESVPTEIHRSFRREPVVVHARRSPSNGRRGAAGSWLVSEPAGQVGGRARRHSLWTSQPSTTSTNARIPVG